MTAQCSRCETAATTTPAGEYAAINAILDHIQADHGGKGYAILLAPNGKGEVSP